MYKMTTEIDRTGHGADQSRHCRERPSQRGLTQQCQDHGAEERRRSHPTPDGGRVRLDSTVAKVGHEEHDHRPKYELS